MQSGSRSTSINMVERRICDQMSAGRLGAFPFRLGLELQKVHGGYNE